MGEAGERKSGRPLQCCVLCLLQHRDTIAMPQAGLTPAWGSGVSQEEGALRGQSVPGERRGGRAVSQGRCCLLPVLLPRASAWSPAGDTAGLNQTPKAPMVSRDSPWVLGTPRGSASQARSPATGWDAPWPDPKPQGGSAWHTRSCPTALGPQAPWSTAHLDRAALLPALLLASFQHLEEEQESPELNSSRVLELAHGFHGAGGDSRDFLNITEGREERPRFPLYLLHGCGHSRGMELILCHPAGRGRGRVQGHVPIQGQGVDHIRLVDVGEDVDDL